MLSNTKKHGNKFRQSSIKYTYKYLIQNYFSSEFPFVEYLDMHKNGTDHTSLHMNWPEKLKLFYDSAASDVMFVSYRHGNCLLFLWFSI